jgi:outer membrane protein insertion porin family
MRNQLFAIDVVKWKRSRVAIWLAVFIFLTPTNQAVFGLATAINPKIETNSSASEDNAGANSTKEESAKEDSTPATGAANNATSDKQESASDTLVPEQAKAAATTPTLKGETCTSTSSNSSAPSESSTESSAGSSTPSTANLTVDEVKIEGNRLVPTEDIMGVVKTKRGDKFDRDLVMQDLKAINNMGYFDDRNLQVVPELTTGGVLLKIRVQENAPVTEFSFQGNQVFSTEDISKLFSQQLGRPQNLNDLSSAIDKVEQAYHEKGYVLARVTDVKDDPDGSVGLNINEGIIDKVEIAGNHKTKDFIIRNAIKIKPGMVYNEKELTADLRKLYANGYFQDIRRSMAPSPDNPDRYSLKVEVEEKRSGSVGLGGGVDTIFGPFGSFNIGDNNFRGRGEVVSFNAQMGTGALGNMGTALSSGTTNIVANVPTYQLEASFIEPNIAGTNTSMALTGFGRDINSFMIQDAMQRTFGASANFTKPLGKHFHLNLGFTGEGVGLRDVSNLLTNSNLVGNMALRALNDGEANNPASALNLAHSVRANQMTGGVFASVSPSISYDTRDKPIDPSQGTLVRLSSTPSLGLTGASFTKFGLSASKYVKVNESTTLATNVQAGTMLGKAPQFAQYWMGGWNGVRGYNQFNTLGTGTSLLMATAEVRTRIPFLNKSDSKLVKAIDKHLKGVLFFDAGQVSGNSTTNNLYSLGGLGASTGLGIRVNVPMIGLIRIDYGMPLVSTLLGHMTPRITIGFGEKF